MNHDTEVLLFGVTDRVQQAVTDGQAPAVVALQGERVVVLTDYDYLRDRDTAAGFERRAADKADAVRAARFVLAVPQVWLPTADGLSGRAVSNLPLRPGEREVIAWTAYDAAEGVDYGHVPYVRRPGGEPVFGDPEIFNGRVQPYDEFPGRLLLQILLAGPPDLSGDV